MDAPSMVQRSGDTLIVRSVVSGDQLYLEPGSEEHPGKNSISDSIEDIDESTGEVDETNAEPSLPQCKIKRNYSCNNCSYFTQNPRHFLTHLRDSHGEKIIINECKHCLYASRHYQKLVRHMKMVHGSTDGLEEQAQSRKRASQLAREQKKRKNALLDDQNLMPLVYPGHFMQQTSSIAEYPNNKLLKCTVCDFSTFYRAQLVNHEREEHNKTKFFRCEKCSYVTHIKARFSKHVKYHSMPMIKCIMCDFRTPYKWNLDRHMKNHGGSGPYKCAACNFTADIKQSLTVHEMNHHVPPVGHASGMSMARRRNKVGGTDLPADYSPVNLSESDNSKPSMYVADFSMNNNNNNVLFDSFNEPFMKKIKMEMLNDSGYQTNPADLSQKPHTQTSPTSKKASRPVPNLIPIQQVTPAPVNLTLPAKQFLDSLAALTQQNISNICANSRNSTLKDLASLFVSEEVFNAFSNERVESPQLSPSSSNASPSIVRKNANLFEELKEKLAGGNRDDGNLMCRCGHSSKCLSEFIIHQKNCGSVYDKQQSNSPVNLSTTSSTGSMRCQYCRHRCKSSADLFLHVQHCLEVRSTADSMESISEYGINDKFEISEEALDETGDEENPNEPHPMENRVFVWNKLPQPPSSTNSGGHTNNDSSSEMKQENNNEVFHQNDRSEESDNNEDEKPDDNSYYGVETAPGYGEVTKKMLPDDEAVSSSLKKVFKCPHCSFWASTASRFHVHIVGHLNKKPFECSLCSYRSNWRWDITKHIRLKTIRDPSHKSARVLMNDETGRRNYTKYNKHITLMKVTEEDGDPKLLKSGEMTPSQEAALSFIGENNSVHLDFLLLQKNKFSSNENFDGNNDVPLSLVKIPVPLDSSRSAKAQSCTDENPAELPIKSETHPHLNPMDDKNSYTDNKKTSFKCKKCNFRHPNREVVLAHVKGHYHDAGMLIEDKYSSMPSSSTVFSLNKPDNITNIASSNTFAMNNNIHITGRTSNAAQGTIKQAVNNQTNSHLAQIPVKISLPQLTATDMTTPTTTEHGEMDEASSVGTSVTGWRDPAPYRCGHCHQVSNWKHVIQRHCRLKHNGDINIESIEKGNKKRVYNRLIIPGSNINRTNPECDNSGSNASATDVPILHTPAIYVCNICQMVVESTNAFLEHLKCHSPPKNEPLQSAEHHDDQLTEQQPLAQQQNQLIQLLNRKSKRYQCELCPYVSPCKAQLENHQSFHNIQNGNFQCKLCSYSVSKKHLLYQHQKMHMTHDGKEENPSESDSGNGGEAMDLRSPSANHDINEKLLMFCKYCPARFLNDKEISVHMKMHASWFPYRCSACTYTSRQESYIETHANVHTTAYINKSKEMIDEFRVHQDYQQPHLSSITTENNTENVWIVTEYRKRTQQQLITTPDNTTKDMDLDDVISASKVPNKTYNPLLNDSSTQSLKHNKPIQSTIDKQILKIQELRRRSGSMKSISPPREEKCPHCPFCTIKPDILKDHMQYHICVSGIENGINCEHCDYSVTDEFVLKEHIKLHFISSSIKNCKNVAFFTCYDSLVLSSTTCPENGDDDSSNKIIYPVECNLENSSDKENRIIVDINTGEVCK